MALVEENDVRRLMVFETSLYLAHLPGFVVVTVAVLVFDIHQHLGVGFACFPRGLP